MLWTAPCVYRKSDSAILVMKAAKDGLGCDDAEALNRPMERGILVQRAMNARFIIIHGILPRIRRRCASPNTIMWSRHSRRIVPISLSTYGFCHGERGAVGLSRMPMARNRCLKIGPYAVSRSRIR